MQSARTTTGAIIPTYNLKNTETDEIFTEFMSMSALDAYLLENSKIVQMPSSSAIVSKIGDNISRTDGGWNDVLKTIKKGSGRGNTINTK
jgi:hypothetical protein